MENFEQDAEKDVSGGGGNQQGDSSSGGGQSGGMDKIIDQGVDKVASEEGVPGMADGSINKEVNSEVGKFT
ncbi:MAG: hypothetical protein ALECFALPRED_009222 [Alectoria fallacina]|uniref:Uncharacterized protein n=1 Tax=Alectoria fallacina TaxID=1903189 RepID=A0A8H3IFL8_9LECA|nr:MAG: hypothetical protein ALECFALPRED_009222 [Alectoria fallacina]